MVESEHKDFLRAYVLGDTEAADAINERIPEAERQKFHLYIGMFLSELLDKRFGEDMSYEDIHGFVREMEYDYRNNPNPIKPLMIEGVLRAINGEERFFDEIPMQEQIRAHFLIITKIAVQDSDIIANIEEYLAKAEVGYDEMVKELGA